MIKSEHTIVALNTMRGAGWSYNFASSAPLIAKFLQLRWHYPANSAIRCEKRLWIWDSEDWVAKLFFEHVSSALSEDHITARYDPWV
jgi:hypothetical protein